MPVELQEQAVVLVLKQFDPCLMQGRRVRQKKVAAFVQAVRLPFDPRMFFIVRNVPTRHSIYANQLIESLNAYNSRPSFVFRTKTPRTYRDAPPCRRPGYLYWSIWIRNCRSRNRRRWQRHCAPRKWPGRIYYHLQGRRLQTIQRRSTRWYCYASSEGDIRHDT